MRILVKIGGAELEEPDSRARFARSAAAARAAGHELVVVHGGGNQIRAWTRRLGLSERYHEGLRVTEAETAEVVLAVLGGLVNRELVRALGAAGISAVGLCGADGGLFSARKLGRADLGYVGEIAGVDARLARELLAGGHVPVIASVAPLAAGEHAPSERFYNINADAAVAPLAAALTAEAVLFLTEVEGVLDGAGRRIERLGARRCMALCSSGAVSGGMIPKLEAALAAAAALPGACVRIAPAGGEDAIQAALQPGVGTRFVREAAGARR